MAEPMWSCSFDGGVRLRMGDSGIAAAPAITVMEFVEDTCAKVPDHRALAVESDEEPGGWKFITYKEYLELINTAARAFLKLGLKPHHGVCLLGFNSAEWLIANLASIFAGGFATGIYTTNNAEVCAFIARDCQAQFAVVEDDEQLQKFLKMRHTLPHLHKIIQYKGTPKESHADVLSWSEFMALGAPEKRIDVLLTRRKATQRVNECCTLIYTSGTTGDPKGVMLSHDNLTWTAKISQIQYNHGWACETLVSFLPLSHVAAQMVDIYGAISIAATVYFARPDALKGSLVETLKAAQPTILFAVPRVWEKIADRLQAVGRETTGLRRSLATWAKDVGLRGNQAAMRGDAPPWGWTIANRVVFTRIREALGLSRCSLCLSGAAPIARELVEYLQSVNLPIYEAYGMSESSGPQTLSSPGAARSGSTGRVMPGAQLKLAEGTNEILFYGRHVFMGYLNSPLKTREAFTEDGWLRSGDIGSLDSEGFLSITGRIKELLITAGGENVAPVPIENLIKESPIVSNVMVVGDRLPYLSCLVTLKENLDPSGAPTGVLSDTALFHLKSIGSSARTVAEAIHDKAVIEHVELAVQRANAQAVSRAQRIQKWAFLPLDFTLPGGELGPTMKLKRNEVLKKFAKQIQELYHAQAHL
eukprot:m.16471 g.16471  ORF g.16471 m.16471 type:complete len:646 (+) comp6906_c1_seq1:1312-3249(+)